VVAGVPKLVPTPALVMLQMVLVVFVPMALPYTGLPSLFLILRVLPTCAQVGPLPLYCHIVPALVTIYGRLFQALPISLAAEFPNAVQLPNKVLVTPSK